jgi:hypothetical protein
MGSLAEIGMGLSNAAASPKGERETFLHFLAKRRKYQPRLLEIILEE